MSTRSFMKILSFINITNPDNLTTDSAYIFNKMLADALGTGDVEFKVIFPDLHSHPMDRPQQTRLYQYNKFQARFAFDWNGIASLLSEERPDVILLHQPELTDNFKALRAACGLDCKIFVYCHYLPFFFRQKQLYADPSLDNDQLGDAVILRFLTGIRSADKAFIHSATAEVLIRQAFAAWTMKCDTPLIKLPPPVDGTLVAPPCDGRFEQRVLLYNHRLYRQYGTAEAISLFQKLPHIEKQIVVTDILAKRNFTRDILDHSVDAYREQLQELSNVSLTTEGADRGAYKTLLEKTAAAFAPFRLNCTWSMSVMDCCSNGIPVIAGNFAWFRETLPKDLLYNDQEEAAALMTRLCRDRAFFQEQSASVRAVAAPFTLSAWITEFLEACGHPLTVNATS